MCTLNPAYSLNISFIVNFESSVLHQKSIPRLITLLSTIC